MGKSKKELPTIKLHGTVFEVDIQQDLIRQKNNPNNRIGFGLMEYRGTHYTLLYDMSRKIYGGHDSFSQNVVLVQIPQKVELDPEAMAKKYKLDIKDIKGKSDFEVMVEQSSFKNRVEKGKLPVIDIAGKQFYVDLRLQELRLTDDFSTKIDLRNLYNDHREQYEFYFRPAKNQIVEIDKNFKGPLNGIVLVRLPTDVKLDPVAVARTNNLDMKAFLSKHPIPKNLTAEIIPAHKTELKNRVKADNHKGLLKKNKSPNHALLKKNKQKGTKKKGKGL